MQTDTHDVGRREVGRYAVVAMVITVAMLVVVPMFRKSPQAPRLHGEGIVPIRIVAAGRERIEPVDLASSAPIRVHAVLTAKSGTAKTTQPLRRASSEPLDALPANAAEDQTDYEDKLHDHIAKYIRYPRAAMQVCPSGTAYIRFQTGRQGELLSVVVERSSGCGIIDDAAVETVRRAQPLPPVPAILPERMTITVPLSFGKG